MKDLPRHPSGRPIRREPTKRPSIWRVPDTGYVTPRLRAPMLAHPIGFTVGQLPGHQDYEDE